METSPRPHTPDHPSREAVTTDKILHLAGVLDPTMLQTLTGIWGRLEQAATTPDAHARAVKSRLFWQTLAPAAETASADVVAIFQDEELQADDEALAA